MRNKTLLLIATVATVLTTMAGTASASLASPKSWCGSCDGGGAEPGSSCAGFPVGYLYLINYYGSYMWIRCNGQVWVPYN